MTIITIILTNGDVKHLAVYMDYESIVFYCREMVEHNDHIKQIVVDFEEGRMIFKAIS